MGGQGGAGGGGGGDVTKLLTGDGGDGASSIPNIGNISATGGSGMGANERLAALERELAMIKQGVGINNRGSKLKRSTRNHDYIKGNTRGYK